MLLFPSFGVPTAAWGFSTQTPYHQSLTYLSKISRAPDLAGPHGRKGLPPPDAGKAVFLKSHVLTHTPVCSEDGIVYKNTKSIASLKALSGPSLGGVQAPSAHCWAV